MNKAIILLSLILITFQCIAKQNINIICEIEGIKNDSALIAYLPQSNLGTQILDTVIINNGKININFLATELHKVVLIPFKLLLKGTAFGRRIVFYIDKGESIYIKIKLLENSYVQYTVKGNVLSEQRNSLLNMSLGIISERVKIEDQFNSKPDSSKTQQEIDLYLDQQNQNVNKFQELYAMYAMRHPDFEYSALILLGQLNRKEVSEIYSTFTENVKNSFFGIILGDKINGWALTTVGIHFPNITDKTIYNKDFSLTDFKGKFVLLDFWGSWCSPCLHEIPQLIEINTKYANNLVLVGIACKDDKMALLRTVENYKIPWIQILDGSTRDKKYAQRFGISVYPTKVLLDQDGKVVKVYNGLDKKLKIDLETLLK